jgi:hypothetical protein
MRFPVTTRPLQSRASSPVPPSAATAALATANTCAAIGEVSTSWWHEAVRSGLAPRPVIQQTRFTRWRLADAIKFWHDRAAQGQADTQAAQRMSAQAKHASAKAREPAAVAKAQASRAQRAQGGNQPLQPPAQPTAQQHSTGGA